MFERIRRYVLGGLWVVASLAAAGLAGCADVNIDVGEDEDEVRLDVPAETDVRAKRISS
ncbi:MAG: hypothetical protein ACLFUJ_14770 [Phycisphaerae bacterium]